MSKHTAITPPIQSNLMGIGFMLLHAVSLSILYAVAKALMKDLDSNTTVFLYKLTILVLALPWCLWNGFSDLKTTRIKLHISRAFFSTFGSLCMFYSLKYIALGDVTAVSKLEQIVLLIVGILYFKEKVTRTKISVILLSFLGAIMIIRPDFFQVGVEVKSTGFNHYYVFVFLAIFFWSVNNTVIKVLGKTEKTKVQLFYVMLFSTIISFPVSFMHWKVAYHFYGIDIKYPTHFIDFASIGLKEEHLKYILVLALCYFGHVIGNFKAFKHAELSFVVPIEYTRLVFAGIFGFMFFNEVPTEVALYGYLLIVVAGLYLFYSEKRRARRRKLRELQAEYDQS
jgi:drug/metabolite transporter (DMT)-like permease